MKKLIYSSGKLKAVLKNVNIKFSVEQIPLFSKEGLGGDLADYDCEEITR